MTRLYRLIPFLGNLLLLKKSPCKKQGCDRPMDYIDYMWIKSDSGSRFFIYGLLKGRKRP